MPLARTFYSSVVQRIGETKEHLNERAELRYEMGWRGLMPPVCFCSRLVQDLENIYSGAVPDHRYGSRRIPEGSGKKPAVFGNIHFRYEVVVRG